MPVLPLVVFHKQLGDVLLLEPALAKLAMVTGSDVVLATRPAFTPMLSLMNRVRPMSDSIIRRASSVISFDPRLRASLQSLTTWAPEKRLIVSAKKQLRGWHRISFPTERRVVDESSLYRAEYFFNAIPGSVAMSFRPPQLNLPPESWLPENLPPSYVLIHTTSAWKSKSWPVENWARTLDELHLQGIGPFVATGGNESWETDMVEALRQKTKAPLLNLCGTTTLAGFLATVANARMVLCIDGSAAHLAAAFQRPTIVLFGPTHPVHWHYPASHSWLIDARTFIQEKRPAVASIPSDAVVNAASELWEASQNMSEKRGSNGELRTN